LAGASEIRRAVRHIRRRDPVLAKVMQEVGPCALKRSGSYFRTLAESIVWQQLSWSAACVIHERMLTALGTRRPQPRHFLEISKRRLLKAGLSRQKCLYLHELSTFFDRGRFPTRRIGSLTDEEIVALLTTIKGIGRWTAEMFLIFALNRLDVFPVGDLGLRRSIARYYDVDLYADQSEWAKITDRWRPYRTIATWYLWRSGDGAPLESDP
jgi:DNA-3-methyladenine glycosylase II